MSQVAEGIAWFGSARRRVRASVGADTVDHKCLTGALRQGDEALDFLARSDAQRPGPWVVRGLFFFACGGCMRVLTHWLGTRTALRVPWSSQPYCWR